MRTFIGLSELPRIAVLASCALILFLFEAAIPRPLPWLKPGLPNIVTLVAFYLYGFRTAFIIVIVRLFVGALALGTFLNPVFFFGLAGGVLATAVMGLFYFQLTHVFSLIGVSIVGAFVHNLIQLILAAFWVVGSTQVFYLLPIMLLSSLFSGFLVGLFAHYVVQKVDRMGFVPAATTSD